MVVLEESGSIGYDQNVNMDLELDPSVQPQEQSSKDNAHPAMSGTKQNSIFSLTLEEIQCKSGRNFGSMNMDEFLTNIWSVEEDNQISLPQPNQGDQDSSYNDKATSQPKLLSREGSFSIPIPLCKKTVDEVWSEIDKNRPQYHDTNNNTSNFGLPQRQQTIGEITLEDFLVKAGVVQESPSKSNTSERRMESAPMEELCGNTNMGNNMSTCLDTNYGIGGQVFLSGFMNPQSVVSKNLVGNGYQISTTYPMLARQSKMVVTELSSGSAIDKCHSLPESSSGSGGKNKKRIVDGPTEVAVERRQRRMIKNRESAARSRARKQAYTVELEAEWKQLKEENAMLKQSMAESEQRRKQEVLRRKHSTSAQKLAEKMRTMRRAVSLAW